MKAAAVILDFDGLVLDTETPVFEAWQDAYRRHGQELGLATWQDSLGTQGGFDPFQHLCELTGRELPREEILAQVQEQNWAECEKKDLLPGVRDLLGDARLAGLGTAVASSSSVAWVTRWLGRHRIRSCFDTVCGRDDVSQVKPAPDLFLLAAERLKVPPEACLVFEDSPNGIRAARRAGMRCVAVPNDLTRRLVLPEPDLVLSSLAERPLGEIFAALGFERP